MPARDKPRPLPQNFIALFFRGMDYPFTALRFMRRHNLWRLAAVSIAVNAVLFVALVALSFWYLVPYLQGSAAWIIGPAAWGEGLWQSTRVLFSWIVWSLGVLLILGINGAILILVGQAVASPFLDSLSEEVENIVIDTPIPPFSIGRTLESVAVSVADLFWGVLYFVTWQGFFLLVGLIPAVGTAPAAVGSVGVTALLLAQEFVGMPLARQMMSYRARWRLIWRNKWVSSGFGVGALVLLFVPGLNLLLLPLATVAGTLLYCDLQSAGRLSGAPGGNARVWSREMAEQHSTF